MRCGLHCFAAFALAEDIRPYLVKWLGIEDHVQDEGVVDIWRGRLLEYIVMASPLYTASNKPASADLALEIFFDVASQQERDPRSTLRRLEFFPATNRISKFLGSGKYHRTDPSFFTRFVRFFEGRTKISRNRQYEAVKLHLCHPKESDPQPAFEFLQRLSRESQMENGATNRTHFVDWDNDLRHFFARLRNQLHRMGRPLDGKWVDRMSHEVLRQEAPPRWKWDPLQHWMSRPIDQSNIRSKAEQAPQENHT